MSERKMRRWTGDNLEGWEVKELIKIAECLKPIYKE